MSDDRAAARAAHDALCATHGVRDLYEGDCRGCGECFLRFVPASVFDLRRLEPYVRKNGVRPHEQRGEVDLTCPWLTDGKECAVYAARPEGDVVGGCGRGPAATHLGGGAGDRTRPEQRRVARRRASAHREASRRGEDGHAMSEPTRPAMSAGPDETERRNADLRPRTAPGGYSLGSARHRPFNGC